MRLCLVQQLHLIVKKARIERNESVIRPGILHAVRGTDSSQLWTARDQVVKTTHSATSDQCPGVAWPFQEGAKLRGAGRANRSEEATETKLRNHFTEQVSQTFFSPFVSKFKQMQTQGTFQNKGTFQGSYPILKFFKAKLEIWKGLSTSLLIRIE